MVDITFDHGQCVKCGACVRTCPTGRLVMTDGGPETGRGGCMGCLQCAAVCPRDAVRADGKRATVPEPFDTLEGLIMSRRSVRSFRPEPPDRKTIQWALDRANYAPSGKNQRLHRFTVVYGRERVEEVRTMALDYCRETGYAPELVKLAEKGRDPVTCGAPVLLLCWSPRDSVNPGTDSVLAMETAELLLTSRGLGSCWAGYLRRLADRSPALRDKLGIPDDCAVDCCLMVGRPAGAPYANIPLRPAAEAVWVD